MLKNSSAPISNARNCALSQAQNEFAKALGAELARVWTAYITSVLRLKVDAPANTGSNPLGTSSLED